ncbi:Sporulation protein OS=Lysinibacillus sphaericus OX=1421 GN=LS41612_19215 PE=4 SV=1 [Lysinibacillus sphaericus]
MIGGGTCIARFLIRLNKRQAYQWMKIFALANAIQHADFTNEKQVRKIVRRVGKVSNDRQITQELEDKIVNSIIQDGASLDFEKLARMMK